VRGGISGITRQAIKDPIVSRGRTPYIYPQNYEGTECTKDLFCTGPTPTQQCDALIPI
jgi:urea transport system substrate-binding protein